MSANKFKYFTVTSTEIVKAKNKSDALRVARRHRGVSGEILSSSTDIDRVSATEAKSEASTMSASSS